MEREVLDHASPLSGERSLYRLGSAGAREHIWIQADAVASPGALALGTWAILDSLLGSRVNQHRHLVLGRAEIAVLSPPAVERAVDGHPPLLDGGQLGAEGGVLAAMRRFMPTLIVHLQDWSPPSTATETATGAANLRMVESFFLEPRLHARLAAHPPKRTWLRRPSKTAQLFSAHPDARLGRYAQRYVRRQAHANTEGDVGAEAGQVASTIRVDTGRYIAGPEWRAIGGGSLCELALHEFGALGICGQVFGGGAHDRARTALALAEAVVLHRLGLSAAEA